MKEDTRWTIIAGIGLLTLSLMMYTAHYVIFQDSHHMWIFLMGDLAFIPIEVFIVTIVIDRTIDAREKQQRLEKLNLVIGTFFSRVGTPLLKKLSAADPGREQVSDRLAVGDTWKPDDFLAVRSFILDHPCSLIPEHINREEISDFLVANEDFVLRIVENPMVFEHESFTDLILSLGHATEELKKRREYPNLPEADSHHVTGDLERVYSRLLPAWVGYMEYLKATYPYLFSLAMRTNPFDPSVSVIIRNRP